MRVRRYLISALLRLFAARSLAEAIGEPIESNEFWQILGKVVYEYCFICVLFCCIY